MDQKKTSRVLSSMKDHGLQQMILTDPVAIFYLTGRRIEPGERLLALLLFTDRKPIFVVNELFPQEADPDLEFLWVNDSDDAVAKLAEVLDHSLPVGIDKTWPSGFLLHLQELSAASSYQNASPLVDEVRLIKDEQEQEKMRVSSALNDDVMEELIPYAAAGLTEKELAKVTEDLYEKHGAEGVSFPPITAYGKNAADPHHETNFTKGKRGDCVVLDIGGMKNGYASDMTRTVFIGEVSDRAREIYDIVLSANLRGIAAAKPGARMCDVDLAARNYIEEKGFGRYFTHRTGHSIGLCDHEYGDVSSANEAVIRPGQCFSVEPGIYIPEEGIGVRIEDLVLITEDGCEVLNHFTKDLIVVPEEK